MWRTVLYASAAQAACKRKVKKSRIGLMLLETHSLQPTALRINKSCVNLQRQDWTCCGSPIVAPTSQLPWLTTAGRGPGDGLPRCRLPGAAESPVHGREGARPVRGAAVEARGGTVQVGVPLRRGRRQRRVHAGRCAALSRFCATLVTPATQTHEASARQSVLDAPCGMQLRLLSQRRTWACQSRLCASRLGSVAY